MTASSTIRSAPEGGVRLPEAGPGLESWLSAACFPQWSALEVRAIERVAGGASYETWMLDVADAADAGATTRIVLRREPVTGPLEPYDIATEAAALAALERSDVPAPRLLAHCADPSVAARPFVVLEHIAGDVPDYRSVAERADWQDPAIRDRMTAQFVDALAALQRVDWTAGDLAGALGVPASEPQRLRAAIDGMRAAVAQRTAGWARHPIFEDAGRWLLEHVPDGAPDDMVLVHGDYRIGNFIWRDRDIVAILDWEGIEIGDRLQDLGYACHPIMREGHPELMAMLAPLDDLVARFEQATGRPVDRVRLHYYVIYALFCHTWALLLILASVVTPAGDVRVITTYAKLNQVTRHLVAQIAAYEEGAGVL